MEAALAIVDVHTDLIGKIAKLHPLAEELESEYEILFKIGSANKVRQLLWFQDYHISKMKFMFINEKPHRQNGMTWYCLKEIGKGVSGDWHWLTLDQLIICD